VNKNSKFTCELALLSKVSNKDLQPGQLVAVWSSHMLPLH